MDIEQQIRDHIEEARMNGDYGREAFHMKELYEFKKRKAEQDSWKDLTLRPGSVIPVDELQNTQDQLNAMKNQITDNNTFVLPPPIYTTGTGIGPVSGSGNVVRYTKFPNVTYPGAVWIDEGIPETERKALDERRHAKLFIHFAKMFVERFEQWELLPDSKDPFKKVLLRSKNGKFTLEDKYPDNEVQMIGCTSEAIQRMQAFANKHGIPQQIFQVRSPSVPTQDFFGWALGMEDVPDFVTNPEA